MYMHIHATPAALRSPQLRVTRMVNHEMWFELFRSSFRGITGLCGVRGSFIIVYLFPSVHTVHWGVGGFRTLPKCCSLFCYCSNILVTRNTVFKSSLGEGWDGGQ